METFVGVLGMVLTVWLGLLFVFSASLKLARYGESASLLRPYRILPPSLASLVGLVFHGWSCSPEGFSFLRSCRRLGHCLEEC